MWRTVGSAKTDALEVAVQQWRIRTERCLVLASGLLSTASTWPSSKVSEEEHPAAMDAVVSHASQAPDEASVASMQQHGKTVAARARKLDASHASNIFRTWAWLNVHSRPGLKSKSDNRHRNGNRIAVACMLGAKLSSY